MLFVALFRLAPLLVRGGAAFVGAALLADFLAVFEPRPRVAGFARFVAAVRFFFADAFARFAAGA